jgi:hypothetical protein
MNWFSTEKFEKSKLIYSQQTMKKWRKHIKLEGRRWKNRATTKKIKNRDIKIPKYSKIQKVKNSSQAKSAVSMKLNTIMVNNELFMNSFN